MESKREMKEECYLEALEDNLVSVEMVLNHLKQIENCEGVFDEQILKHDRVRTTLDLELGLATLCILLRKMSENVFISFSNDLRKDMNSLIHSNRFEYNEDNELIVYSQKGRESVDLEALLNFCHSILSNDKKCK